MNPFIKKMMTEHIFCASSGQAPEDTAVGETYTSLPHDTPKSISEEMIFNMIDECQISLT